MLFRTVEEFRSQELKIPCIGNPGVIISGLHSISFYFMKLDKETCNVPTQNLEMEPRWILPCCAPQVKSYIKPTWATGMGLTWNPWTNPLTTRISAHVVTL